LTGQPVKRYLPLNHSSTRRLFDKDGVCLLWSWGGCL